MYFSRKLGVLAAAVVLAAGLATRPAPAQEGGSAAATPMVLAVVDMTEVLRQSTAAQDIREQIETRRQAYQEEIQKKEQELRNAQQELARQRTILSPEAFKEERQKFEERFVAAQRAMQQRKMELEEARSKAMVKVRDALKEVIEGIVQENNITLLLRHEQTVYAAKPLMITDVIAERLNKKLPSVKVFAGAKR